MPRAAKKKTKRPAARRSSARNAGTRVGVAPRGVEPQLMLARHQLVELRKLARDRGTSVAVELSNAVDAYVLGIAPTDIGRLDDMLEKLGGAGRRKRTRAAK